MTTLGIVLVLVGGVLAVVRLAQTQLKEILAWGVLSIAVGLLLSFGEKALH